MEVFKYLRIADLRDFELNVERGQISYGRAVQLLNEVIDKRINIIVNNKEKI